MSDPHGPTFNPAVAKTEASRNCLRLTDIPSLHCGVQQFESCVYDLENPGVGLIRSSTSVNDNDPLRLALRYLEISSPDSRKECAILCLEAVFISRVCSPPRLVS